MPVVTIKSITTFRDLFLNTNKKVQRVTKSSFVMESRSALHRQSISPVYILKINTEARDGQL